MRGTKLGLLLFSVLATDACAGSGTPHSPIGVTRGRVLPRPNVADAPEDAAPPCQVPRLLEVALLWPDAVTLVSAGHPVPGPLLTSSVRVDPAEAPRYRHWSRGMTWSPGSPLVQFAWAAPGDWEFALVLEKKRAVWADDAPASPELERWQATMIDRTGCEVAADNANLCLECHRGAPSDGVFGGRSAD
jgi:hypothetical protein